MKNMDNNRPKPHAKNTQSGGEPVCLFDGDHVQLLHYPGSSEYSLVTFHIMHAKANGRTVFADKLAKKKDIDLYGIVPKYPCWYPMEDMEPVCTILNSKLNRPAIAYGSSMGGYGALRYGRQAGCSAALAFSPQGHISPEVTGRNDIRYAKYYLHEHHENMAIMDIHLCDNNYIFYDPNMTVDQFQRDIIGDGEGITTIQLPFTGHKTVMTMASSVIAPKVFSATLQGKAHTIRQNLLQNRRANQVFYTELSKACSSRGHIQWALDIANLGIDLFGQDSELIVAQATALAGLSRISEAVSAMQNLTDRYPGILKYRLFLMKLLEQSGDTDALISHLKQAVSETENFPLYWKLIKIFVAEGDKKQARLYANKAAKQNPERVEMLDKLLKQLKKSS